MTPRLLVEVRWGPLRGAKVAVAPGEALSIGREPRTAGAEPPALALAHDRDVHPVHATLRWDGARAALEARAPLERNGERVRGVVDVEHGDWLRVGESDLVLRVEGTLAPTRELEGPSVAALAALAAESSLFAILDAARDDRILAHLREAAEPHLSLYDGFRGELLEDEAPYLVPLPRGSQLLARLVREGWGRRWGVYARWPGTVVELRAHLRRFLIVRDDVSNERLYFRFYDPAVLRAYLPTCTPGERRSFFGRIDAFLVEGAGGEVVRLEGERS